MNTKKVAILSSGYGVSGLAERIIKKLGEDNVQLITPQEMEEKVKSTKEIKIKAVEQAEQIESAEVNDDYGLAKSRKLAERKIPMTNSQNKARAKNKRAKKARKINHGN